MVQAGSLGCDKTKSPVFGDCDVQAEESQQNTLPTRKWFGGVGAADWSATRTAVTSYRKCPAQTRQLVFKDEEREGASHVTDSGLHLAGMSTGPCRGDTAATRMACPLKGAEAKL
ncbi:unnamed protein product [Pleuronectes platessa]|uniref:Uncharacterized protein n=1 Tax=Pleuronectes platessa TaxID=8262 RepID=A0A9N7YS51_PLEPL|nr:unnamed protein product [Pleuronectes platessa]